MKRFAGLMTGLAALGTACAALAAETAEHGEHGSGGMPQLDPGTFGTQIFWLAVFFAGLYWLVSKKVVPTVEGVLDERNSRMQGDLDAAARLRAEAEEVYARHEAELAKASGAAQETVNKAREHAAGLIANRTADLQSELDGKIEKAVADVAASSAQALKSVDGVAAEAAVSAVKRLIGVDVSAQDAEAAVSAVK